MHSVSRFLVVAVLAVIFVLSSTPIVRVEAAFVAITPSAADTEIREGDPDSNRGGIPEFNVGYVKQAPAYLRLRGLIRFDLSSIPAGSVINSAKLKLRAEGNWAPNLYDPPMGTYTAFRATFSWDEFSVTWNNAAGGGGSWSTDNAITIGTPTPFTYCSWDVTGIVRDWIQNGEPNYGFIIVSQDLEGGPIHAGFQFRSREILNYDNNRQPILEIDYDPPPTPTPTTPLAPVSGLVMPTNKLEILTPYIALAGLIAAISTVYVIKKRKD